MIFFLVGYVQIELLTADESIEFLKTSYNPLAAFAKKFLRNLYSMKKFSVVFCSQLTACSTFYSKPKYFEALASRSFFCNTSETFFLRKPSTFSSLSWYTKDVDERLSKILIFLAVLSFFRLH